MEKRGFASQAARPSDGSDTPRQPEQAAQPAYQAAAPQPSRDTRVGEPAVATDGQTVEAGYGHGV